MKLSCEPPLPKCAHGAKGLFKGPDRGTGGKALYEINFVILFGNYGHSDDVKMIFKKRKQFKRAYELLEFIWIIFILDI